MLIEVLEDFPVQALRCQFFRPEPQEDLTQG
jgi:hypothetical protein